MKKIKKNKIVILLFFNSLGSFFLIIVDDSIAKIELYVLFLIVDGLRPFQAGPP